MNLITTFSCHSISKLPFATLDSTNDRPKTGAGLARQPLRKKSGSSPLVFSQREGGPDGAIESVVNRGYATDRAVDFSSRREGGPDGAIESVVNRGYATDRSVEISSQRDGGRGGAIESVVNRGYATDRAVEISSQRVGGREGGIDSVVGRGKDGVSIV
jgi:hypothetical protein